MSENQNFIQIFKFVDDISKPGRILSTAKIGEVYMSRLLIDPGITTGNIYHKDTSAMFFVERGEVLASFENIETKEKKDLKVRTGTHAIHIPPFVANATKNIGTNTAVLVFFTDKRLRSGDDFDYHILD